MSHAFYVASVSIHILAAMIWIGGMLFLALILVPALKRLNDPPLMVRLVRDTGRRFRTVGWVTLITLVVTGTTNLMARGVTVEQLKSMDYWKTPFGSVLAFKLICVLCILTISLVHDFNIGPNATEKLRIAPNSAEGLRLRKMASWMGRTNMILAIVVAVCGVMLVRGRPW